MFDYQLTGNQQSLHEENLKILQPLPLKMKVYDDLEVVFGKSTSRLSGSIHENGYLYLESDETQIEYLGKGKYAVHLKGKIDEYGRVQLVVVKNKFNIFAGYYSKSPVLFEGTLDVEGNIEMRATKFKWYFMYTPRIHKLICDPFENKELSRQKYLDNLKKIKGNQYP